MQKKLLIPLLICLSLLGGFVQAEAPEGTAVSEQEEQPTFPKIETPEPWEFELLLEGELIEDETARKEFNKLTKELDDKYWKAPEEAEGHPDELIHQIDLETFHRLREFIILWPGTTSALTAKLRAADLAVGFAGYVFEDKDTYRQHARRLKKEIAENYPDTWQGIVAHLELRPYLRREDFESEEEYNEAWLERCLGDREVYERVDMVKDAEFIPYRKRKGRAWPWMGRYHFNLAYAYQDTGRYEDALKEYEWIKSNCKDEHLLKRVQSKIDRLPRELTGPKVKDELRSPSKLSTTIWVTSIGVIVFALILVVILLLKPTKQDKVE